MSLGPLASAMLQAYAPTIAADLAAEVKRGTAPEDVLCWLHENGGRPLVGSRFDAMARLASCGPNAEPLFQHLRQPADPGHFRLVISCANGEAGAAQAKFITAERPAA